MMALLRRLMKYLLVAVAIVVVINLTLVFGMFSVVQQNEVFRFYYRVIKSVMDSPAAAAPGTVQFNADGQLTQYPGKQVVAKPEVSKRTMVAFVFGQSNAANHGGQKFSADSAHVYNFWNGQYYLAQDPLLGASGNSGSVWTLTANKLLAQQQYDQVILIPAAIGGTSVGQWQPGGELHHVLLNRLQAVKNSGLQVTHFLWHQGEADNPKGAKPGIDLAGYKRGMQQIIALTRAYFPESHFYLAVATRCFSFAPASPELQAVQRSLVDHHTVFLGPNTDEIEMVDRYDDCHFSASGLEKHAEGWVNALSAVH